jgi:hypothetical protein
VAARQDTGDDSKVAALPPHTLPLQYRKNI